MEANIKNNKDINKLMKKYGDNFISIITKDLLSLGKKSSGKLIRSLQADLKLIGETISIAIKSEDYLIFVDQGRKPGSYPPINKIEEWCRLKNIPTASAFPIARNIYKKGIKPTNVISKSIKKWTTKTVKDMEKELTPIIEKELIKIFK